MQIDKKLARLEQLKLEHRTLDNKIKKDYNLRLDVSELKVQKLRLKNEIILMEKDLNITE
jgi:hypothetical protein